MANGKTPVAARRLELRRDMTIGRSISWVRADVGAGWELAGAEPN